MTGWTSNVSGTSGNGFVYYETTNPYGFTQVIQANNAPMQSVTLIQELDEISAAIVRRPDHEFYADEDGCYCQLCPGNSIYIDDRGAHPYVIREWEIG